MPIRFPECVVTSSGSGAPRASDVYDSQTLEASEGFVNYHKWLMSKISGAIHGRTLEVGAGTGTMSGHVEPLSSELVLVEPAFNLADGLTHRFADHEGVRVVPGTLGSAVDAHVDLFAGGFDTIVSFNVLEHIDDDVGTLRLMRPLLRPGGRIVLIVPSLPFLYGSVDAQVDHLRRYTKTSLTAAIAEAGMATDRIEYLDFLGMVPWFIFGRVLRRTTQGGGVGGYDRYVIPVCRAFDRVVGPPIGKNLVAVASAH